MAGHGTMKCILQADESILDAAFTAHTVRHGCGESGQCEARQVLRDTRASLRRMLGRSAARGPRERTTSQPRSVMWTRTDLGLTRRESEP